MRLTHDKQAAVLDSWRQFTERCLPAPRLLIAYHTDVDGVLSAAAVSVAISARADSDVHHAYGVTADEYDYRALKAWLPAFKADACVSVDLSIENDPSAIEVLSHGTSRGSFVFDHHVSDRVVNGPPFPDNVTVVNPTPGAEREERAFPSFLFGALILEQVGKTIPNWLLLLALFVEGVDQSFEAEAKALLRECFPSTSFRGSLRDQYRQTSLPRISTLIRAALTTDSRDELFAFFVKVIHFSTPMDQARDELERYSGLADKIAASISSQVDKHDLAIARGSQGKLVTIEVPRELPSTAGPVASILRGKHPDRLILTWYAASDRATAELRTSQTTGWNLASLLSQASTTVPMLSHGGHPTAAGALLEAKQLPALFKWLEQHLGVAEA